jgi:hypothetical protein
MANNDAGIVTLFIVPTPPQRGSVKSSTLTQAPFTVMNLIARQHPLFDAQVGPIMKVVRKSCLYEQCPDKCSPEQLIYG